MEIDRTNPLMAGKNGVHRIEAPQQTERPEKTGDAKPDTDRLELSVRSIEISHLNELIQATPDVREEQVERVRKELENGTYSVKAEKIAGKIIKGNLLDEIL